MADVIVKLDMSYAEAGDVSGKVVNIYDSYAHAIAYESTGLVTIKEVDPTDGTIGSAITQTPGSEGAVIDNNGKLLFAVDTSSQNVFWGMMKAGRSPAPFKILAEDTST